MEEKLAALVAKWRKVDEIARVVHSGLDPAGQSAWRICADQLEAVLDAKDADDQ